MEREVEGNPVRGIEVDPETRCAHYGTERDVVAIRFACCDAYHPCFRCHQAVADHPTERLPVGSSESAVLCGVCGTGLTPSEFVEGDDEDGDHACPECEADFNPGCADHYDRYFDLGE